MQAPHPKEDDHCLINGRRPARVCSVPGLFSEHSFHYEQIILPYSRSLLSRHNLGTPLNIRSLNGLEAVNSNYQEIFSKMLKLIAPWEAVSLQDILVGPE
jgi:hypothetical protein